MEEKTRQTVETYEITAGPGFSFDPLSTVPMKTADWLEMVTERVKDQFDAESLPDETVLAVAKIYKVSYIDSDTAECDVRFEARYEVQD